MSKPVKHHVCGKMQICILCLLKNFTIMTDSVDIPSFMLEDQETLVMEVNPSDPITAPAQSKNCSRPSASMNYMGTGFVIILLVVVTIIGVVAVGEQGGDYMVLGISAIIILSLCLFWGIMRNYYGRRRKL
jgi:hypothetical protein